MIAQLILFNSQEILEKYKNKYSIVQEAFHEGLLAVEIRDVDTEFKLGISENIYFKKAEDGRRNILLVGHLSDINKIINKNIEDNSLRLEVLSSLENYLQYYNQDIFIGSKVFPAKELVVMGILNATPDSFSDGGKYLDEENAYAHVEEMISYGADIIDIGGESTRPGSEFVSEETEMKRILPIITKMRKKYPDILISVDTSKAVVAKVAMENGADIVNDISGGTFDKNMFQVVKEANAAIILMHIKGTPKVMQDNVSYYNLMEEVYDFLWNQKSIAEGYGIKNIFIDPGIGFAKNISQNLEIIKRLPDLFSIGVPIVIGNSRKSFLGKITGLETSQRDVASVIADTFAVKNGARIIRTHNVQYAVQLKKFNKAINN